MSNHNKGEWNLSLLLKSENPDEVEKIKKQIEILYKKFIDKWKKDQSFLKNPEKLKEALDEYEKINRFYGSGGPILYYYKLKYYKDQNNSKIRAELNKIKDFVRKLEQEMMFFTLNLSKIPEEKQKEFLNYKPLAEYHHLLKKLFESGKHTLSESEEKILMLKYQTSYDNWVKLTSSLLSKEERLVTDESGKKSLKNMPELTNLTRSHNNKVRREANEAINDILKKYEDIAEAEINSILLDKKYDDELRKYNRPDAERHLSDDIKSDTVDTLIKTVSDNFHISKKYYNFKKRLLKLKSPDYGDRNVDYISGKNPKHYSYEQSVKVISEVLKKLDKEFLEIFEGFVKNGHIDVYPKKGKRDGACCTGNLIEHPTYILLNYTNKLQDLTTLAHEFGHGLNNELIKKRQNSLNYGTPLSTAEVASTFIEEFVTQKILETSTEEQKFELMLSKLADYITTILRQIACYKFEQELHEEFRKKSYLSKEEIGSIFKKNMQAYLGEEFSRNSENWWIAWPHIRDFFYVYSYANGLLISKSLASEVKRNPQFIIKVKEFLSAGLSESPEDIFKKLGININDKAFWQKGLNEISQLLDETEKLAKKLGKI